MESGTTYLSFTEKMVPIDQQLFFYNGGLSKLAVFARRTRIYNNFRKLMKVKFNFHEVLKVVFNPCAKTANL